MPAKILDLTSNAVVYAVYHDTRLVHLGESDSIARPAAYVQAQKKAGANAVTARYIEITTDVLADFAMPTTVPANVLFHGNLERLLHAAFFWQHGALPEQDRIRGGKGANPVATGGFVRSVNVIPRVFAIVDELLSPNLRANAWPTTAATFPESIPPEIGSGPGRPATRDRHLAFWVDFSKSAAFIGHVPTAGNQLHYSSAAMSLAWPRPAAAQR